MKSHAMTLLMLLVALLAPQAWATNVPDLDLSIVTVEFTGEASVYVYPDGNGLPLTEAYGEGGVTVDATITLALRFGDDTAVINYPREDIWLETADSGLVLCALGSIPDADTDSNGETTWTQPLKAGGHSQAACHVIVAGSALIIPGLPFKFNSPDINGDLAVDLSDLSMFAENFYGAYHHRADYTNDQIINLSDLAIFAAGYQTVCP
jgi:hypothetical protein